MSFVKKRTKFNYTCEDTSECTPIELYLKPNGYFIELWGASGGTGQRDAHLEYIGGSGAYVSGVIRLNKSTKLYLYIGGRGSDGDSRFNTTAKGGYNGGGIGGADTRDNDGSGGGGGATDLRLIPFDSTNLNESLRSRIMVAAGGSGSEYDTYGAPGGDLYGYSMRASRDSTPVLNRDVNQTNGYEFGIGSNGVDIYFAPASGAGGGYYGGFAGTVDPTENFANIYKAVSSSGSSFVSGYPGCNAVDENGLHTNQPIHYSKLFFKNIVIERGIFGTQTTSGNGAAIITPFDINFNICSFQCNYFSRVSIFQLYVFILL